MGIPQTHTARRTPKTVGSLQRTRSETRGGALERPKYGSLGLKRRLRSTTDHVGRRESRPWIPGPVDLKLERADERWPAMAKETPFTVYRCSRREIDERVRIDLGHGD